MPLQRLKGKRKYAAIACLVLAVSVGAPVVRVGAAEPLKAGISKTDLGVDLEARYGVLARKADRAPFKAIVDTIRPGSMAFYSGLRSGDRILDAKGDNDRVKLTFDRGGKVYSVSLAPLKARTQADAGKLPTKRLSPAEQKQLLAQHDVVLIIDRTGSMDSADCPGGKSRWKWCGDQALNFMEEMHGYVNDLTIVTFNNTFETYPHAPAGKVQEVFAKDSPTGGTNAAAPLHSVLADYFKRREAHAARPVIIAMITDGLPNLPDGPDIGKMEMQKEIVSAVSQMKNSAELTITFLQVGEDYQGGQFLTDLSERLGVPYDIVDTKTFAELKKVGLREALVDALGGRANLEVEAKLGGPHK